MYVYSNMITYILLTTYNCLFVVSGSLSLGSSPSNLLFRCLATVLCGQQSFYSANTRYNRAVVKGTQSIA